MKYAGIILTVLFLSCATTERNNPFDVEGRNWNPPEVTAETDTIVDFAVTTNVTVKVKAADANNDGGIEKYYWDIGADGWDDSTDEASYSVTSTAGGPVTVRWAARDDDGVFSYDTFNVIFNRPPESARVTAPDTNDSWVTFDWLAGNGSFPVTLSATEPDGKVDTLSYTLYTGASADSLSLACSGRRTVDTLAEVDSASTVHYRLVAYDLLGDSTVSTGTFTAPHHPSGTGDIDGNFYPSVVIGNQEWTTVNLRVTRFNDGTAIPIVSYEYDRYWDVHKPYYCFYNNSNDTAFQGKYGALYNWYAMSDGKLAPATGGWRVPTGTDFSELRTFLGGWDVAGGKMKVVGTDEWLSPNTGATNSSGFSALPSTSHVQDTIDYYAGMSGYWWISSEYNEKKGFYYLLQYDNEKLAGFGSTDKRNSHSIRLVRDVE